MNHGMRVEDIGLGRVIKYWPLLLLIFTVGGWYRESQTNALLVEKHELKLQELDTRETRVEDAVISLQKIADWTDRHRH
jgi:hypothetical protein